MKICIVGAGAIGGFLGTRLAISGFEVSMLARGPHFKAMKENGVTLTEKHNKTIVKVPLSDDPSSFGVQDFVILTLKQYLSLVAALLRTLLFDQDWRLPIVI